MKYICVEEIGWADETDIVLKDVINEVTYQKYLYAKEKLGNWTDSFYFGTNEGFDDFNYLGFDFQPISDDEMKVLKKFHLPKGHSFVLHFLENFQGALEDRFPELCEKEESTWGVYYTLRDDLSECSLDTFKFYVDTWANEVN